jgi:hypothetical protein
VAAAAYNEHTLNFLEISELGGADSGQAYFMDCYSFWLKMYKGRKLM